MMRKIFFILLILPATLQAAFTPALTSFNCGEVSPLLEARSDFPKYGSACRTLENFFALTQGPVTRRPGTKYIADTEDPNVEAILIPFNYSERDTYAMEFGHNLIRFYRNGAQILDDDDAIYELTTVFEENELPNIQFVQLADMMYIVNGTAPPQKLTRYSHSYWTIADVNYIDGPFLAEYSAAVAIKGDFEDYALDKFPSTARELASVSGTASGAVANTNDNDDATYRKRQGYNTRRIIGPYRAAWAYFTIEIPFNSTADNIQRVTYKIGWYNGNASAITHTVSCQIHYDTADEWVEISTDTDESVDFGGDWDDVNGIKLYIRNNTDVAIDHAYAGAYIYEIEAWGLQTSDTKSVNYIKSSNTQTYDRTLDASGASDQGGTPNIVRIPSTDHGFLAGDYVTLSGTTNYDGTHEITNINDADTFDIASAFTAETFATTDTSISRALIYTMEDSFYADHIGALWQIRHPRTDATLDGILDANESTSAIACEGDYTLETNGTWTATIALERSNDSGVNWETIPESLRRSTDDDNIDYSDSESDSGYTYRVTMSDYTSGSATYTFIVSDHMHTGVVRISEYIDANNVTAEIITALNSVNKTSYHSEGYWSDKNGWPQTIALHEQRIFFGGSDSYPQTIWATRTASGASDDFENMTEGANDDDALIYVLPGQNQIQWLLPHSYLMIGTLGGAGRIGDPDEPIAPASSPQYKQQVGFGSAGIQAILAGDTILYIQNGGKKVREFIYTLERDRFITPDMTILAEHITGDGIVDIAFQSRPDSVLWCVLNNGDIATMTYQRDQEVVAWALQTTEGDYESVTVIPGIDEDEVWVIVKRTIDSNDVRYVERFQPRDWGTDQTDCYFVDSGLSFNGGDAVNITDITQADPAVVTVSAWPVDGDGTDLTDGDEVMITGVSGMTEVNDNIYTLDDSNTVALTFSLNDSADVGDVNSVDFTAYTSGGTAQRFEKNFSGLGHLEGKEVAVFADGGPHQNLNVSSATIQLSEWSNKVVVGLPYTSVFETLPLIFNTPMGSTIAMKKRIIKVSIDFYETLGASYGKDADNLTAIDFDSDLCSDWKECSFQHGHIRKATIYIETSQPVPLTIRAIVPLLEIYE